MPKLKIAPSVATSTSIGLPMAEAGRIGLFVNRSNFTGYIRSIEYIEAKNEIPILELELDRSHKTLEHIIRGAFIVLTYNQTCVATGVLSKPETTSRDYIKLSVQMVGKDGADMLKAILAKADYTDEDIAIIIDKLCSLNNNGSAPWIIEPGNVDSIGGATVRVDNNNKLNSVIGAVRELGLWWKITHPAPASGTDYREEDRFNVYDWEDADLYPEKNNVHYRPFNQGNSKKITKEVDVEQAVNYLRLLGAGDGRNQLESICTHATLNRSKLAKPLDTWLTQDEAVGATTLHVTNTEGLPASGTLNIDGETVTYSALASATTITCTATTNPHASDAEVINISPDAIYLVDSSLLPSSGNVWVGNEKISYTTKDDANNKLTGTIARASVAASRSDTYKPSVRFYYAHGRNCPVWDAQYAATEAGAQAGSSIKLYGLLASVQTNTTIIDQNALDVAGGNLIEEYYTPPIKVTLESKSPNVLEKVELGDMLRVEDEYGCGANDDYRLYEMRIRKSKGNPKVILILGNSQVSFSKDLAQTKKELGNLSVYAQGVPQTLTINAHDDCQGTDQAWTPNAGTPAGSDDDAADPRELFPLKMEFYIPDNAISIDTVKLDYFIEPYRAYASVAEANGYTADTNIFGANFMDDTVGTIDLTEDDYIPVCEFFAREFVPDPGYEFESCRIYIAIASDTQFTNLDGRLGYYDGGWNSYSDFSMVAKGSALSADTGAGSNMYYYEAFVTISVSDFETYINGNQLRLYLENEDDTDLGVHLTMYGMLTVGYQHTHAIEFGIQEGTKNFNDIKIAIDDGNGYVEKTTEIETDIGTTLNTTLLEQLDVTKYFGDTSGKKGIKVLGCSTTAATTQYGRISGILRVKYFETNRT